MPNAGLDNHNAQNVVNASTEDLHIDWEEINYKNTRKRFKYSKFLLIASYSLFIISFILNAIFSGIEKVDTLLTIVLSLFSLLQLTPEYIEKKLAEHTGIRYPSLEFKIKRNVVLSTTMILWLVVFKLVMPIFTTIEIHDIAVDTKTNLAVGEKFNLTVTTNDNVNKVAIYMDDEKVAILETFDQPDQYRIFTYTQKEMLVDGEHIFFAKVIRSNGEEVPFKSLQLIITIEKGDPIEVEPVTGSSSNNSQNSPTTDNILVSNITISEKSLQMQVGEIYILTSTVTPSNATNQNVQWSSSNTSVASVSAGVVSAKSSGTTSITVSTGGYSSNCTIIVNEKPTAFLDNTIKEAPSIKSESPSLPQQSSPFSNSSSSQQSQQYEWSDWSTQYRESNEIEEVQSKTQYRFCIKETTTSNTPQMSGWEFSHEETTTVEGDWSSWSTNSISESNTVKVQTKTQYSSQDITVTESWSNWSDWSETPVSQSSTRNVKTKEQYRLGYENYEIVDHVYRITIPLTWFEWSDSVYTASSKGIQPGSWSHTGVGSGNEWGTNTKSEWRTVYCYQDLNTSTSIGSWSNWSDDPVSASSTRQVQERTVYRFKESLTASTYHFLRWGDWSGWMDEAVNQTSNMKVQERTLYRYRVKS